MRFGSVPSSFSLVTSAVGVVAATPGATVSIDVDQGCVFAWTAGQNETVDITGSLVAGASLCLIVANDSIVPRTLTFGAGFKVAVTVVGTANKTAALFFICDGSNYYEVGRTTGIV